MQQENSRLSNLYIYPRQLITMLQTHGALNLLGEVPELTQIHINGNISHRSKTLATLSFQHGAKSTTQQKCASHIHCTFLC